MIYCPSNRERGHDAYKKGYEDQKKELDKLEKEADAKTTQMDEYFRILYESATQKSTEFTEAAVSDADRLIAKYAELIRMMDEAERKRERSESSSSSRGSAC